MDWDGRSMNFLLMAGLVLAQDAVPWRTDVVVARQEAFKDGKPIVILLGLDAGLSEVRNIQPALAKFGDLIDFCKTHVVVGLANGHEANDAIRKEFSTWPHTPWIVVLDGKGERMGAMAIHKIMERWGARSADLFPKLLLDRIRGILARKESLPALEARWVKESSNEELFDELTRHFEENLEFGRVAEICDAAAAVPAYPKDVRETFRIRAFFARCEQCTGLDVSPDRGSAVLAEAARLLIEMPDHPLLHSANRAIVNSSDVRETFDLPGKRDALIEGLRKKAETTRNAEALEWHMENIAKSIQWLIDSSVKKKEAPAGGEEVELNRAKAHARLGDAQATIDFFSRAPHDQNPMYQAWVREAKSKLAK